MPHRQAAQMLRFQRPRLLSLLILPPAGVLDPALIPGPPPE